MQIEDRDVRVRIAQVAHDKTVADKCHALQRRVGLRPDGTLHTVCNNHGALTPPYSERPISEAGKQRISAAAKAMWKRYHALKAAGLPAWQVGRKKLPAKPPKPKARPTPKPQQRMTDSEWLAAIRQDLAGPYPQWQDSLH